MAGDEDRFSQPPRHDHLLHRGNVRLQAILEEDADLHPGAVAGFDDAVDLRGRHVERLLRQHVEPAPDRGDGLLRVHARRCADGDDVERAMIEEAMQIVVGRAAVLAARRCALSRLVP